MIYSLLTIVITILAAYALLILECFLPTSGFLAILSIACLVASVTFGFSLNAGTGFLVIVVIMVATPIVVTTLVRIWPRTRIGQKILNLQPEIAGQSLGKPRTKDGSGSGIREAPASNDEDLIESNGIAMTDLNPNGIAFIDGETFDVVSHGEFIPRGSEIFVTHKELNRLRVRRNEH